VSSSRLSVCSFYNIFPDKFLCKSFLHFYIKSYLVGPFSIFCFYSCNFVRVQAQSYSEEAFLRTPVSLGALIEHQSNERQRWNGSDLSLLLIGTRSKLRGAKFVCLRTLLQQQITNMDPAKEQETMHGLTSTCHTETFITSIDKINQTCIII